MTATVAAAFQTGWMPLTDLSLAECLAYRPVVPEPPDLDAFWAATLDARAARVRARGG